MVPKDLAPLIKFSEYFYAAGSVPGTRINMVLEIV